MRKILEAIALLALALLGWITARAFTGPDRLPDKIPTHFDLAGHVDGWGPAGTLLLLPAVVLFLYLGMTLVARYPSSFNYPVRVTRQNQPRLQALALNMIAWLKTELVCLFAALQWVIVRAARHPGEMPVAFPLAPAAIVAVFATVGWHFMAMRRATHTGQGNSGN